MGVRYSQFNLDDCLFIPKFLSSEHSAVVWELEKVTESPTTGKKCSHCCSVICCMLHSLDDKALSSSLNRMESSLGGATVELIIKVVWMVCMLLV